MLDITPNVSIQGILGPLGNLKMYAGKGIYRVIKTSAGNIYGYGMIGAWSYPLLSWNSKEGTETVMGFGAGIGLEVNLKALYPNLFSNLSPISCNAEIGLRSVKFKEASCYFPIPISIGAGIHYRF